MLRGFQAVYLLLAALLEDLVFLQKIKNVIQKELKIVHMLQPKIYQKRKRNSI